MFVIDTIYKSLFIIVLYVFTDITGLIVGVIAAIVIPVLLLICVIVIIIIIKRCKNRKYFCYVVHVHV